MATTLILDSILVKNYIAGDENALSILIKLLLYSIVPSSLSGSKYMLIINK